MRAETTVEESALACDYIGKALICGAGQRFRLFCRKWNRDENALCLGLHTENIVIDILYDAMIAHGMQRFEISAYVRIDTVLIEEIRDICAGEPFEIAITFHAVYEKI